jgi:hypothetical protein
MLSPHICDKSALFHEQPSLNLLIASCGGVGHTAGPRRRAAVGAGLRTGFPPVGSLVALAIYAAVFGWLAVRFFRWQ